MPNFIFIKVFALTGLLFLLSSLTAPISGLASHKVFQDNFDDGNANGWVVTRNPCVYNGLPAEWKVVNNQLGIKINGGGCVTEIMPNDSLWNSLGNDYIIEFDMNLVSGTDHNFAFRYTDPDNWYDFHIQSPGSLIMQRMLPPPGGSIVVEGDFSNGQTIHFKIIVKGDSVKLYRGTILPILIFENPQMGGAFPTGRIALQASAGGDPSSETYFDNIVVTNIDEAPGVLPVPYYTQNSLPWGPSEYDSTTSLGFSNTTMDRWGCAVTSAAMTNYHGMTNFPNNNPLDPGSLNNWLKTHNGYLTGRGSSGSYSYLTWPAIGKLTKELFDAGKSSIKLTHKRAYPSANTTVVLNDDLNIRKFPDILYVNNSMTSGHFVVAKGVLGNTYAINDPEWNYPDLSSFNNSYTQVDRYIPSNTNFSYIVLVVNPEVELLITDSFGNKTGKQIVDGQIQEFNQILDATYAFEAPISNPDIHGTLENLGMGVNVFLLPTPPQGNYSVEISSNHEGIYTVNFATFKDNGEFEVYRRMEAINSSNTEHFGIQYSQTEASSETHAVTFDSFKEDIGALRGIGEIKNFGIYISLLTKAEIASIMKNIKPEVTQKILMSFLAELNAQRGKGITEDSYQTLLYDVNYLITHL